VNPAMVVASGILGGTISAGTHATKSGSRLLINASPEPVSNWVASITEDVAVIGGVWAALVHPWTFLLFLIGFIILMIWFLPKLWRGIKQFFSFIGRLFNKEKSSPPSNTSDTKNKVI